MDAMTFAGRRGEVAWGGSRGRHYDAFVVGFGIMVPLVLGDLVHAWDFPATRFGSCKAIRLRPDAAFKRRVLMVNWAGTASFGLIVGSPFLWTGVHAALGALALIGGIALAVLAILACRQGPRDRQIRLLLGPHSWGSSDPATWSKGLRKLVVDPQEAFQVKSWAALARQAMSERRWSKAMWAARLCVAVENEGKGEELTDAILAEEDVRMGLQWVYRNPDCRQEEFGKPYPLQKWVTGDPDSYVFRIG